MVERKHRHILNVARALKFQANIPAKYWGECVEGAVYLINRLPSALLIGKSPFELLYGKPPLFSHLRVFGCLCYATNLIKNDKFGARSRAAVFLGYAVIQKGYKLLDLNTKQLFVSRDVVFKEHLFPFTQSLSSFDSDPFHPILDMRFDTGRCGVCSDNGSIPVTISRNSTASSDAPYASEGAILEHVCQGEDSVDRPVDTILVEAQHGHATTADETDSPAPVVEDLADIVGQAGDNSIESIQPNRDGASDIASYRRKSTRVSKAPLWHEDYVTPDSRKANMTIQYPLSNSVSYHRLSAKCRHFIANVSAITEPLHFREASKDVRWVEAMQQEIKAPEDNDTWAVVDLPKGKNVVGSKWVYKIKYKANGEIERFKARLVAKGYSQKEGLDCHETFSPVTKMVTIRAVIALATSRDWPLYQMDVYNAFLQGDLLEEVYMELSQGFRRQGETKVCRLLKSLYGLKQASRQWNIKLSEALTSAGYSQSLYDYSMFTKRRGDGILVVLVYVDDLLITGNSVSLIQDTKETLHHKFKVKDLG